MIHHDFKLNGVSFTEKVLREIAYDLIKEGQGYEKAIGDFLFDWLDSSPTITVRTSGATGEPKLIVIEKQQMINSAKATGRYFKLNPGDRALLCLSAEYIAGKMMLVRSMILGLHLESLAPVSNPLSGLEKEYDFAAMVPIQLQNSLQEIDKVKTLLVGGAPLSPSVKQQLKKVHSRIYETYGMTETITHVAVKVIETALNTGSGTPKFKGLPDVIFTTDDRNCLVIDAPMVSDEKVVTNDVVELFSATEFEWLGRYDNVINSGGVKLFPERVEQKLADVIDQRFFVTGIPDEVLGQKLMLFVEGEVDSEKLLATIKSITSLDKFEIPKEIKVIPEFLKTETGKIQRQKNVDMALS